MTPASRLESRGLGALREASRAVLEPRTLGERRRPPSGGRLGDSRAWKGSRPNPGGTALDRVLTTLVKNLQGLPSASASQPVSRAVTSTPAGQPPQPPVCSARLSSFWSCLQYLSPPHCLLGSCLLPGPHLGCPPAAPSSAAGPLEPAPLPAHCEAYLGPRPQGDVTGVIRRHPRDQDGAGWSAPFTAVIQGGIAVEHCLVSGTVSSTFHEESHFNPHKPFLKRTPFHPSHLVKEKRKLRQVK